MLKPAFLPAIYRKKKCQLRTIKQNKSPYHQKMVFYLQLKNRWNAAEQIEKSVQSRFSIKQLLYCYGGHLSKL